MDQEPTITLKLSKYIELRDICKLRYEDFENAVKEYAYELEKKNIELTTSNQSLREEIEELSRPKEEYNHILLAGSFYKNCKNRMENISYCELCSHMYHKILELFHKNSDVIEDDADYGKMY